VGRLCVWRERGGLVAKKRGLNGLRTPRQVVEDAMGREPTEGLPFGLTRALAEAARRGLGGVEFGVLERLARAGSALVALAREERIRRFGYSRKKWTRGGPSRQKANGHFRWAESHSWAQDVYVLERPGLYDEFVSEPSVLGLGALRELTALAESGF